jgi:hypothetical protein
MQVRVARHTNRLAEIVRFYRDGLGLRDNRPLQIPDAVSEACGRVGENNRPFAGVGAARARRQAAVLVAVFGAQPPSEFQARGHRAQTPTVTSSQRMEGLTDPVAGATMRARKPNAEGELSAAFSFDLGLCGSHRIRTSRWSRPCCGRLVSVPYFLIRNGSSRQVAQRQYHGGGGAGACGRAPARRCCCQFRSCQAQRGSGRGRTGRVAGTTTTGFEGGLALPVESKATTR